MEFNGTLAENELRIVLEVGLNTLLANGALPLITEEGVTRAKISMKVGHD